MKKVLIMITIMLIMITGKVYAQSYTVTPSSCNLYYGSNNTNRAGTIAEYNNGGNTYLYSCYNATAQYYKQTGYIHGLDLATGNYNFAFMVYDITEITNVFIRSEGYNYPCEMNTGIIVPVTGSIVTGYLYSVSCYNVHIRQNNSNQIVITRATANLNGGYGSYISKNINITPVENVTGAINNQTDSIINANDDVVIPTAPSSDTAESIEQTEADLIEDNQFDASTMNIQIDSNASNFIWSKITSIVQANAKVFSMIITCLSLGIIKLVFNR